MQNTQRSLFGDISRLMTRRSRSGQSIIIIALGFIVLIAFVGIATDAALLFVRYSTLRRAVDAAAVAAAGQIRENTSYSQVAAAATQYIRLHGLDPASVKVETCETEIDDHKRSPFNMVDNPVGSIRSYLSSSTNGVPNSELCRPDPAKLVRVSAQIISPTTFLSIIGYRAITLSASSISQTAVMDVVLMLDGSLSMGGDTISLQRALNTTNQSSVNTYLDSMPGFAVNNPDPLINGGFTIGLDPYTYLDTNVNDVGATYLNWRGQPYQNYTNDGRATAAHPYGSIRAECRKPDIGESANPFFANYGYGGCCNDPATQATPPSGNTDYNWYIDARTGLIHTSRGPSVSTSSLVSGQADGNYSDLVCRPFKDVRDATRRFLLKVDFTRGDRVILIQFDARVNAITSSGVYSQGGTTAPVFVTKYDAITALNKYVGIEKNPGGQETTCQTYFNVRAGTGLPYDAYEYLYETVAPCPDTNTGGAIQAASSLLSDPRWIRKDAVWIAVLLSDGYPNRTPGVGIGAFGNNAASTGLGGAPYADSVGAGVWNPNFHIIPNNPSYTAQGLNQGGPTNLSYERFFDNVIPTELTDPGFCPWSTLCDPSGGQFSDSLRLYQEGRTTAGNTTASYPPLRPPDLTPNNSVEWNAAYCDPTKSDARPIWWDMTSTNPTPWHPGSGRALPFCSNHNPDARHFCVDRQTGNIAPGRPDLCSEFYDAQDFARDRVDFAALIDWTPTLKGNFIAMFSIFFPHRVVSNGNAATNYLNANILGVKFMRYVADAGDNGVIDNPLQHWYRDQAYVTANTYNKDPIPPGSSRGDSTTGFNSANLPADYRKTTDPCSAYDFREQSPQALPGSLSAPNTTYETLAATSCGNYYYAGTNAAIDRAFTDIASRLFTRLAR
jgi:Flp pilus assembly protein TadG